MVLNWIQNAGNKMKNFGKSSVDPISLNMQIKIQ
jgi:hypothetical protein